MNIRDVLNRLEAEERRFLDAEVVAPVLPGRRVVVRIAGVVCRLTVDAPDFQGWGVVRPLGLDRAQLVRPARLAEIAGYLRLLPAVRLIAVTREEGRWHALPAQRGDRRIQIEHPVPVLLAEDGLQPFSTLVARYDGQLFWHERVDGRRDPTLAAYLRQALDDGAEPAHLRRRGLSAEERAAYNWAWGLLKAARHDRVAERLADALAHAGARLLGYVERPDAYTVAYEVGRERHISTVRRDDLTVLTAGICLSGRDRHFDLASLVGVMGEANTWGRLVRVGQAAGALPQDAYERAHPPVPPRPSHQPRPEHRRERD
jgi:hypothetical protein